MWTKRKTFKTNTILCDAKTLWQSPLEPAAASDDEMGPNEFNFIATVDYTLISEVSTGEAKELSRWVFDRWLGEKYGERRRAEAEQHREALMNDAQLLDVFYQIEYFFLGTENGQLFCVPLLPPALLQYAQMHHSELFSCASGTKVNNGPRRLLHAHQPGEPVHAVSHLGSLVASGSADKRVYLSFYHPTMAPLVALPQPHTVRSVKLWEGNVFTRQGVEELEEAAVYVFVSDEASEVRLWRVDVTAKTFLLLHVFVMTPNFLGATSSLFPFTREDNCKQPITRETTSPSHCMCLDGDRRLLVGTEGGIYVWALDRLSWRCDHSLPTSHPFCWDEESGKPLSYSVCNQEQGQKVAEVPSLLSIRSSRLVNHHVWVRDTTFVIEEMSKNDTCKWKPKYGTTITSGFSVGVVCNGVEPSPASKLDAMLTHTPVTVSFEGGEVKNDVTLPLSCVEPVVYPLTKLPTAGAACFALQLLCPDKRLVSSASDGRITVWVWNESDAKYVPALATNPLEKGAYRGLGRHLCLLRSPDVFISCNYDEGLVKEWHIYDEPELLLKCERRFTLMPGSAYDKIHGTRGNDNRLKDAAKMIKALVNKPEEEEKDADDDASSESSAEEFVAGVSCITSFPAFTAIFVVGAFESEIQTFTLSEVQGCAPPSDYVYNGYKTIKMSTAFEEEIFLPNPLRA